MLIISEYVGKVTHSINLFLDFTNAKEFGMFLEPALYHLNEYVLSL